MWTRPYGTSHKFESCLINFKNMHNHNESQQEYYGYVIIKFYMIDYLSNSKNSDKGLLTIIWVYCVNIALLYTHCINTEFTNLATAERSKTLCCFWFWKRNVSRLWTIIANWIIWIYFNSIGKKTKYRLSCTSTTTLQCVGTVHLLCKLFVYCLMIAEIMKLILINCKSEGEQAQELAAFITLLLGELKSDIRVKEVPNTQYSTCGCKFTIVKLHWVLYQTTTEVL